MMNPFQKLGDLNKMRNQAMQIQRELSMEKITIEKNGIIIIISGDQKFEKVLVDGREEKRLLEALNEAVKKSQEVAARKLQSMGGGLGGLLGQ